MGKNFFSKNTIVITILFLTVVLTIWWIVLQPFVSNPDLEHAKYIWGSWYQIIALIGGISGFVIARSYGGFKSVLGRSISLFSLGLLFQCLGQSVYSYYNLFSAIQAPYPSLGDVGYFGSVILYSAGVLYLAKASGVKISMKSSLNKVQAILIPLVILGVSYGMFLQHYTFEDSTLLKIVLDFGYPLGQAFYVSIAILTLILSRKMLGGIMREPILFFLIALIVQYIADFNFLFHANNNTWFVGGVGDFLYLFAYVLMALSIIQIGTTLKIIRAS
jgi:hypothetical protein